MYYYTEFLRAVRALRVMAIILAVVLVIGIILRIWAWTEHGPHSIAGTFEGSPTAQVKTETLKDGTIRKTIDDPVKHVHAVVEMKGTSIRIDATAPSDELPRRGGVVFGNSSVKVNRHTGMSHIVFSEDVDGGIYVGILFAIACVFALVTATMLGGTLAKENDGHLEIAWTKPVSRERLALAYLGVDIAAIVVSQLMAVVALLLVIMMFVHPHFVTTGKTPQALALALLVPPAWYAFLTAFSASLKRGLGMVVGFGWFAALVVPAVAQGTAGSTSDFFRTVHFVFQAVSYLIPISYATIHGTLGNSGMQFRTAIGTIESSAAILFVLTIVYLALAVLQWRRVEA